MADEQENAVHLAITLAASHYAPQEWFELPSRHRTWRSIVSCVNLMLPNGSVTATVQMAIPAFSTRHRASAKSERIFALTARPCRRAHSSSSPG